MAMSSGISDLSAATGQSSDMDSDLEPSGSARSSSKPGPSTEVVSSRLKSPSPSDFSQKRKVANNLPIGKR